MTLPIRGKSFGNPDDTAAIAIQRGGKKPEHIRRYAAALWEACRQLGIRADIAFAQADLETGDRHTGVGFSSARWFEEGNVAGLGIVTGMPDAEPGRTFEPEAWAVIHATHLAGYAGIDPPEDWKTLDFRWQPMIDAGYFGVADTVDDLDGRWATSPGYGDKIAARHALYGFATQDPVDAVTDAVDGIVGTIVDIITRVVSDALGGETEDTDMAGLKKHRFVGLDKDVLLPDDIEVIIDIVPSSRTNVRSNQRFTGQTHVVYHQTGNFSQGANAWSERNYLHGGAGGRYVGYNFAVDDRRIIQLTPLSETTWHAGQAWWNQHSWGVEQCVGGGINRARAERNASALHGGLCAAKGWDASERVVMHQRVYGKLCPQTIIQAGTWPTVLKNIVAFAGAAAGKAVGDIVDGWPYPDPVPPSFWSDFQQEGTTHFNDGDTVWYKTNALYRVKTKTRRQQYAVQDNRVVGPELEPGTEFRAGAIGQSKTDKAAWVITPMLTRVRLDALEFVEADNDDA